MRKLFVILLVFCGLALAAGGVAKVVVAVSNFCRQLNELVPVVAMLMIVIGAVIYAAGQMMGAETRARANVWATATVTGAIMAMLIIAITPSVLQSIYGSSVTCAGCGTTSCPAGLSCCTKCGEICMTDAQCRLQMPC